MHFMITLYYTTVLDFFAHTTHENIVLLFSAQLFVVCVYYSKSQYR